MLYVQLHNLVMVTAQDPLPGLVDIPALQRRRLSPLSKLALNSAVLARTEQPVDTIIWASQFGDEEKTSQLLLDVARGHTPSPTQFSMSVNNAIAGLYSILFNDTTPAISLSGGLRPALLEACTQLRCLHAGARALLVVYDEALPAIYQQATPFDAFSLAMVFSLESEGALQLNPAALCAEGDGLIDVQTFVQGWQQNAHVWPWPP